MDRATPDPGEVDFVYNFQSNGCTYRLQLPLEVPYRGVPRELAVRLVKAHRIPCHLEDDLCERLVEFISTSSLDVLDQLAERSLYGGSVFEKGSETDVTINKWAESFVLNCAEFSPPGENSSVTSNAKFAEVYHKLIHSSALETLLQLEHTYAMAVDEVIKAWDNARGIMQERQDADLAVAMAALESGKSEHDFNLMMRKQTLERESCEERWSNELNQLQESQRREYREWVTKVHEDMESHDPHEKGPSLLTPPKSRSAQPSSSPSSDDFDQGMNSAPPLEESYTINLGSQKKTTHNIRIIRESPLNFCRHKRGGVEGGVGALPNPERLQTAMSLYSSKLAGIIMMVDGRVNSLVGLKEEFAGICHQSTDFHFPDIDVQLQDIREKCMVANVERKEQDLSASNSGTSSGSQEDNGATEPHPQPTPTSHASEELPGGGSGLTAGTGVWGGGGGGGRGVALSPVDSKSVCIEPGDFYLTRHSNLSQVHAVFHLVTDESEILSSTLNARHRIMTGLKNCLRTATRHDITHITVPLLLVHTTQPEMTISWCLKRAELVFKCVKGFMLETTAWSESDSRTIQFLVPTGISEDMFEEFCDMLPKIFRVTSSRNLTTRTRAHSYK